MTMTVNELITELSKLEPDAKVYVVVDPCEDRVWSAERLYASNVYLAEIGCETYEVAKIEQPENTPDAQYTLLEHGVVIE